MEEINRFSNSELSSRLKDCGLKYGPITSATRKVFEGLLRKHLNQDGINILKRNNDPIYTETNPLESILKKVTVGFSFTGHTSSKDSSNQTCEREDDKTACSMKHEFSDKSVGIAEEGIYYGVCIQDKSMIDKDLVFLSLKDACEAMKGFHGARLKSFSSREDASKFANQILEVSEVNGTIKPDTKEISQHKDPKPQELVLFRSTLERGDAENAQKFLRNPKYLISLCETPVILQEGSRYNAMHVAVKANKLDMVRLIIAKLEDSDFWRLLFPNETNTDVIQKRSNRMLDYYVNTPDRGAGDTPLHIACKFGYTEITRYLASLPFVEKDKPNKFQETPEQVIFSRCPNNGAQNKEKIADLLSTKFYVPLLRMEDDTKDPIICSPVPSCADAVKQYDQRAETLSPVAPKVEVKAYAGPMTADQAHVFFKEWRSPYRKKFLNDFEKGKERLGRQLANEYHVPWIEYWPFLGCFADLSSTAGLEKLENYFRNCVKSRHIRSTVSETFSDSKLFLRKQSLLNGRSPLNDDFCVRRLLDDFNQEDREKRANSPEIGFPLATEVCVLEQPEPLNQDAELELAMNNMRLNNGVLSKQDDCSLLGLPGHHNDVRSSMSPQSKFEIRLNEVEQPVSTTSDPINSAMNFIESENKDERLSDANTFTSAFSKKSNSESDFSDTAAINQKFFILGQLPSKFDFDVMQALRDVEFDPADFPFLHVWKENVSKYSDSKTTRWPSPCSPRYRSRLVK